MWIRPHIKNNTTKLFKVEPEIVVKVICMDKSFFKKVGSNFGWKNSLLMRYSRTLFNLKTLINIQ